MVKKDKIKGGLLIIFGIFWLIFVYNFDRLMGRPTIFDIKAIFGFIIGIISIVNGRRIYRRKNNA